MDLRNPGWSQQQKQKKSRLNSWKKELFIVLCIASKLNSFAFQFLFVPKISLGDVFPFFSSIALGSSSLEEFFGHGDGKVKIV